MLDQVAQIVAVYGQIRDLDFNQIRLHMLDNPSAQFRRQLREDLTKVFGLVRDGAITPQIAARYPLSEAAEAMRFAEAGGFTGKVLLLPSTPVAVTAT